MFQCKRTSPDLRKGGQVHSFRHLLDENIPVFQTKKSSDEPRFSPHKVYAKHLAYIQADLRRVDLENMTTVFSIDAVLSE